MADDDASQPAGVAALLGGDAARDDFFANVFGKAPRLYRRPYGDDAARNGHLHRFHPEDMEELLSNAQRSDDDNALLYFREGKSIDVRSPFFAYAHDCSVVVNRCDRFSSRVVDICESLEADFPYVFCNLYLTPPAAQTVRAHSDDRDVLALQILGEKEWTVYDNPPVPLPYRREEVGKGQSTFDAAGCTTALHETVREGDVLYLPRGYVHCGKTSSERPSLHLTMAIQTSDWDAGAIVLEAATKALRSDRCYGARQVLSQAALRTTGEQATTADRAAFSTALEQLIDSISFTEGTAAWRERLVEMRAQRRERIAAFLRPVLYPLTQASLLLWNGDVSVAGGQPAKDTVVTSIRHAVVMRRGGPDGPTMILSMSDATRRVAAFVQAQHREAPVPVRELPLPCPLGRLCVANWLLRNECFVRVS